MNRFPSWFKPFAASIAGLLLFLCLTIMFVPAAELQRLAARALAPYGLTITASSFGKAFPLGINAKGFSLSGQSGELLSFDRLELRLRLLPLFLGRVVASAKATIGTGTIESEAELTRKGRLNLSCSNIRLEAIPFFKTVAGAQAKGDLRIKGEVAGQGKGAKGALQIEARDLDLKGVTISGTQLPDASYKTMQGMLRIKEGKVNLESVTLKGDGLYVRLSGDFPAGYQPAATPLNLKVELMPKPEFLESQKFVFLLLAKYTVSPGNYLIPIRGTLASPQLQ
ncbi:type II secretion system protein GspN [Geobacter pelophilus]|uniref:Type II secretion system protein GspN n=1 Tax=Geoanaerobacter pelophilus TaxID=60036 RepID=A0AAW4KZG3_9BACT|nr:type II secretion system protein GspN [Geoanaerobacter pelophilus]MBT0664038.1 type II secretion system protein GspN [Geoanaerobacter pelophilus]